jgi:hypothetical protein
MPSKYKPRPKVKLTAAELRVAAEAMAPIAASLAEHVTRVAVERHRDGIAAPRRGRGQRLTPFDQLQVFFYASAFHGSPREIARALGFNHATTRRLLSSGRFAKFQGYVDQSIAHTFSLRRHTLRARRFLAE